MSQKNFLTRSDKSIIKRAKKIALSLGIVTSVLVSASGANEKSVNNEEGKDNEATVFQELKRNLEGVIKTPVALAGWNHSNGAHNNINQESHNSYIGNADKGYHYSAGTHMSANTHSSHTSHSSY